MRGAARELLVLVAKVQLFPGPPIIMQDHNKNIEIACITVTGIMILGLYLFWAHKCQSIAVTAPNPQVHRTNATWVSRALQGKAMADGSAYNNRAFTIRVPKGMWPLGAWVLVESNGKKVCVQVTDWCKHGRVDLSEAAFAQMADVRRGIIGITIKDL